VTALERVDVVEALIERDGKVLVVHTMPSHPCATRALCDGRGVAYTAERRVTPRA
jgi:hypothetical protein